MLLTILFSIMMMTGLFLMMWGGVGFIQDKRFFSSAPKEIVEVVPDRKPERFKGQPEYPFKAAKKFLQYRGKWCIIES